MVVFLISGRERDSTDLHLQAPMKTHKKQRSILSGSNTIARNKLLTLFAPTVGTRNTTC